ncbi:MAG: basic amino acid ABC transporter substrate-binding protein [Clostridia bacterium]|nr:basic amino acid ABC transporter substrate-binding protein [Clostridia bacterium]
MKTFKKVMAILMALALTVLTFASCGNTEKAPVEGADAPAVLRMGTNAAFPPYEYVEGEKIVGIDAEIAELLAEKLGMTLEITDMDFGGIISAVQNGIVDIGLAGMTVTDERLESVNFSESYATGIQVVIVPEDSDIKTPDDLNGKLIGVQEATTGDAYATDDFGEESVKRYTNGSTAVAALLNGSVDAVIIDNEPAKVFVEQTAGLKLLDTEYVVEDYAIAVAKDNTELLDKINTALAELKADGSIDKIIEKYIPAE